MFQILKINGEELGFADTVRYIKIAENGCYVESKANEAIGIAFKGEPHKLDEVILKEVDGGKIIEKKQTMNELAIAELAEAQTKDQTQNELALAELAEMIGGTN